jgi:hypothetical protein
MLLAARSRKAGQSVDPISRSGKYFAKLKTARDADMLWLRKEVRGRGIPHSQNPPSGVTSVIDALRELGMSHRKVA